jgi:nicotinamidase-related amidase
VGPLFIGSSPNATNVLEIEKRSRVQKDSSRFELLSSRELWQPQQTALIICDMWDQHWCPTATKRVEELAPFMNQVVQTAREKGVFIIHAPSDVTDFYAGHPARERAIRAPKSDHMPPEIKSWCSWLDEHEQKVYPIDQSDGGCECEECDSYTAWSRQVEAIEIMDDDAISSSGEEIWNLMEARGIQNVMIMGVHTNMCVLGRPFGLRNMARYGKNVVLVRDLTDTMYNPKSWPYVDHFTGTDLIIEHIEKYVCPTITSTVLTGRAPFRFQADNRH